MTEKKDLSLAVIGLGYVGLPLAVEFGKMRSVVGLDINPRRIEQLRRGEDLTREITPAELSEAVHLVFSSDAEALKHCDFFIVTVPTPIDDHKRPDLLPLLKASEMVGKSLKKGDIVVYESTVYPGCTEEDCVPVLERFSGLKFNRDFFCGYSPERINPGDKEHRLTNIRKVTSGSTPEVAEVVDSLYRAIVPAGTHKASSIRVAEAAKVIENTQRDLNIALMNELSVIFERMGIDTLEVLEAAGTKWNFLPFKPGMVGGHCIGVDPYYLTHKAEALGYNPQVILAGRRINDDMARYVARNVVRLMISNGIDVARSTVGVMGITFKENCPDIRNSKVIDIIDELKRWNVAVVVSDPWADAEEVRQEYGVELSAIDGSRKMDALVIAVAHDQFRSLPLQELRGYCRSSRPVLADVKGVFDRQRAADMGFTVFRL